MIKNEKIKMDNIEQLINFIDIFINLYIKNSFYYKRIYYFLSLITFL